MVNDFYEERINNEININGYAIVPFASKEQIESIKIFYNQLPLIDAKGTYVTMFHPSSHYRQLVDEKLKTLFEQKASSFLKNYRVLFANFMIKTVGEEGVFPVHQDWTYVDETKYVSYAFWIPLQDTDIQNGALHVVPNSHKIPSGWRGPYIHEPFHRLREKIKTNYSKVISLKAGEALIWDHRLIHFSQPNLSSTPRLVFTLIMVPKDVTIFHCFGDVKAGEDEVSIYAVDSEFYLSYTIGERPKDVRLIEKVTQNHIDYNDDIFENLKSSKTTQHEF